MPCVCEVKGCFRVVACGERLCEYHFLDTIEDNTAKCLYSGGRFYPSIKEDKGASAPADVNTTTTK